MYEALSFGFLCFTSLFTIIDPIGVAPVFVAMTEGREIRTRRRAAGKACAVALSILALFAVAGGLIFKAFGITIEALRIAGGILFFATAMRMLTGRAHEEAAGADPNDSDPAIVPLGMPLICGPGAITTVMVLMGQATSGWHVAWFYVALVAALSATALVLLAAPALMGLFGRTGVAVTTRVVAMIVCAIGIQFVIDGVRPVAVEALSAAMATAAP
jgi:multiple antibiotic resistance protein